jgi:hypothetical protein
MSEPDQIDMMGDAEVRAELRDQVKRTIELQQQLTEANRRWEELQEAATELLSLREFTEYRHVGYIKDAQAARDAIARLDKATSKRSD